RINFFTDQPPSRNFTASESSSAWLLGLLPVVPKLSGEVTRPCPNSHCQMRFTITRAVSGLPLASIHSASSRRPLLAAGSLGAGGRLESGVGHLGGFLEQLIKLGLLLPAFLRRQHTRQHGRTRAARQFDQLRGAAILRGEERAVMRVGREKNSRERVVVLLRD